MRKNPHVRIRGGLGSVTALVSPTVNGVQGAKHLADYPMSAGPILIFDKSILEALSMDEAVWLGRFYRVNMTPLFFIETLADLERGTQSSRSRYLVVYRTSRFPSARGTS